MTKFLNLTILFLFFLISVSGQNLLTLSDIEEVYNAPINKKEIKIINKGFTLAAIQPTAGQKMYNKGYVYNSHYKEGITYTLKRTEFNDPVGNVAYQTWVPTNYAKLSEHVSKKYKYLGNHEFNDGSGLTFDLYEGNGFIITVYSFTSGSGKMVGNIVFRPI